MRTITTTLAVLTAVLTIVVSSIAEQHRISFSQLGFSSMTKQVVETNQEALEAISAKAEIYGEVYEQDAEANALVSYLENPSHNHYLFSTIENMVKAYYENGDLDELMVDYFHPALEMQIALKEGNEEKQKNERAREEYEAKMAKYSETEKAIARSMGVAPWKVDQNILSQWAEDCKKTFDEVKTRQDSIISQSAFDDEMIQ